MKQPYANNDFFYKFLRKATVGEITLFEWDEYECELQYYIDGDLKLRFRDEFYSSLSKVGGVANARFKLFASGWYPDGADEWDINNSHVVKYIFKPLSDLDLDAPISIDFVENSPDKLFIDLVDSCVFEQFGKTHAEKKKYEFRLKPPVAFPFFRVEPFLKLGEHPYDIKFFFSIENVHRIYNIEEKDG